MSRSNPAYLYMQNVSIENNALKIDWSCPRCRHYQTCVITDMNEIRYGKTIKCQNVAVCGEGNSYMNFDGLDFGHISYADKSDTKLSKPKAA